MGDRPPDRLAAALADRYRIQRELGEGGMATVYLAHDVKHDRSVALKVLRPELAAAMGGQRFLAEIRTTANLQHPHILSLFDSGEVEGTVFYVMPYVEGESLRQRLERERQLPMEDAVRIATEVAGALDYAHRHGVIHRDIKPENILLHDGQALVADFGIALAAAGTGGERITETGISLGTPTYMSPEQATGERSLDARSDVYSLGCVLYEMLTGEAPFTGPSAQAVLARLMTERPKPPTALRDTVPPGVEAATLKALARLPADRFATAHAFADALAGGRVLPGTDAVTPPALPVARARTRSSGAWFRVGAPWALALGFAGAFAWSVLQRRPPPPTTQLVLHIPASRQLVLVNGAPLVISPDGRSLAYAGLGGSEGQQLYYQRLDELDARALPGTDLGNTLFFSADSRSLGFEQGGHTLAVAPNGGAPATVDAFNLWSPSWAPNGDIYGGSPGGLRRLRPGGRTPDVLTQTDSALGETAHLAPILGPDGKTLVFWVRSTPPRPDHLALLRLDTKRRRDIAGEGANPLGVVDGYLIFGRQDGTLNAVRYDPRTLRSVRDAVPVVRGVLWKPTGGVVASLSRSGSLIYVRGGTATRLLITDDAGKPLAGAAEFPRDMVPSFAPGFSPDGRRVAVPVFERGTANIWVFDLSTTIVSRLTSQGFIATNPVWTPDGKRIAFIDASSRHDIWWTRADGDRPAEKLASLQQYANGLTFSPDARYAVIEAGQRGGDRTNLGLLLLPLTGKRTPTPLFRTPFSAVQPAISPGGKFIAYASDETGQFEIYLRPFPGPGAPTQISANPGGAISPQWTRDGRLVYRAGDSVVVATLTSGSTPHIGQLRRLFQSTDPFSVSPDGRRFAILRPERSEQQVVVVLNWVNALRVKMAGGRNE